MPRVEEFYWAAQSEDMPPVIARYQGGTWDLGDGDEPARDDEIVVLSSRPLTRPDAERAARWKDRYASMIADPIAKSAIFIGCILHFWNNTRPVATSPAICGRAPARRACATNPCAHRPGCSKLLTHVFVDWPFIPSRVVSYTGCII
jgi:hypothetical protein